MVENLIPDYPHHVEALLASNAVDNHIAVNADEVLAVQYRVFILYVPQSTSSLES